MGPNNQHISQELLADLQFFSESFPTPDSILSKILIPFSLLPFRFLQTNKIANSLSIPTLISKTRTSHGFRGFYRGSSSFILILAINKFSFELTSPFFLLKAEELSYEQKQIEAGIWTVTGGFVNGLFMGLFSSPLETVLIRMQMIGKNDVAYKDYSGLIKAFRTIRTEAGLWKGALVFTAYRALIGGLFSFWGFYFEDYLGEEKVSNGLAAMSLASLGLFYPLDCLRVKMQFESMGDRSVTYRRICGETMKKLGVRGFFAGMGMYCLNVFAQAIFFNAIQ